MLRTYRRPRGVPRLIAATYEIISGHDPLQPAFIFSLHWVVIQNPKIALTATFII